MKIFTFNNILLKRNYNTICLQFKLILWIILLKPIINILEDSSFLGLPVSILEVVGLILIIILITGLAKNGQVGQNGIYFIYKLFLLIYLLNITIDKGVALDLINGRPLSLSLFSFVT